MRKSNQLNLFDLGRGIKLRDGGMGLAASNRSAVLNYARSVAVKLAMKHPLKECTIDDVQKIMIDEDLDLGMAAGSVFKGPEWRFTGKFKKTARSSSHARNITIWRLK